MSGKTALLFPAFVHKYSGKEASILAEKEYNLSEILTQASKILDIDLSSFDISTNNFMHDEQKNQFVSYILSCAFSDISKRESIPTNFVSGFSMGIYAAYYHTGILSFNDGLLLIRDVYELIQRILNGKIFSMVSVVGFTRNDLHEILKNSKGIEIVIQNGTHSYILTGEKKEVHDILETLKNEGAIHINQFEVYCPYHSAHLFQEKEKFYDLISKYNFQSPSIPIVSMVDNKTIRTSEEARTEIVNNVCSSLNFFSSIQHYLSIGVTNFIEIGPGDSLLKSSKFIDGEFTFNAVSKGKIL